MKASLTWGHTPVQPLSWDRFCPRTDSLCRWHREQIKSKTIRYNLKISRKGLQWRLMAGRRKQMKTENIYVLVPGFIGDSCSPQHHPPTPEPCGPLPSVEFYHIEKYYIMVSKPFEISLLCPHSITSSCHYFLAHFTSWSAMITDVKLHKFALKQINKQANKTHNEWRQSQNWETTFLQCLPLKCSLLWFSLALKCQSKGKELVGPRPRAETQLFSRLEVTGKNPQSLSTTKRH